jgi:hypothetical protein
MNTPEIEYAATSHHRFLAHLWRELPNGPLMSRPASIRILTVHHPCMLAIGDHPIGYFKHTAIVPGGRYLITITTGHIVQMWDLGFTAREMINGRPVATAYIFGLTDNYDMLVQPSPDGNGIRFLLVINVDQ